MYNNWESLESLIKDCQKCQLCKSRTNIVIGEGDKHASLMIIAEAPGSEEDKIGRPFVGRAGKILNDTLAKIGISRKDIYMTNVVKCHPPANRNPMEKECLMCKNYLRNQVLLIKPKIIVLLGSIALKNILGKNYSITKSRGKWIEIKGIKYMPTWHPAAILRDESKRESFTDDLILVAKELQK